MEQPFKLGEVLWIDNHFYPRTSGFHGAWAFLVERLICEDRRNRGWFWLDGHELSSAGLRIAYRRICIRPDAPRRRFGPASPLPPIAGRRQGKGRWERLEDLRGTATGRPYNYPGRLRFGEAER